LLGIAYNGADWIATPTNTATDDITYKFQVIVTDGLSTFSSMANQFYLHVGCPSGASSETFTFVDNAS